VERERNGGKRKWKSRGVDLLWGGGCPLKNDDREMEKHGRSASGKEKHSKKVMWLRGRINEEQKGSGVKKVSGQDKRKN